MTTPQGLADVAALLADPSRAALCLALLDGRAWTVTELARHAGIAVPTASEHVTRLVDGGLLVGERQGRHRYVRLTGPHVAELVEDLAAFGTPPEPVGLRAVRAAGRLAAGRTCYDHLAGDLGVSLDDALHARGHLHEHTVTDSGRAFFTDLLGPQGLAPSGRRPLTRPCLDWTRRVPHLGGALGAALCRHLLEQGWVVRPAGDRAVAVTPLGTRELKALLDLQI